MAARGRQYQEIGSAPMNIALLSLIGLCIAIIVSGVARVNVGILAMSLAWLIGYYLAGMKVSAIMAGFPIVLATMLFGMTFLFGQAQQNGTLGNLAGRAISLAHGQRGVVPLLFFMLPLILATIGPGNIAAVALIAPLAMAIAGRAGISAFLMTLMVANGANAGAFSPFAPTGNRERADRPPGPQHRFLDADLPTEPAGAELYRAGRLSDLRRAAPVAREPNWAAS